MAETENQKNRREKREAKEKNRRERTAKKRSEEEKHDAEIAEMRRKNDKRFSGKTESEPADNGSRKTRDTSSMKGRRSLAQIRARHALETVQQIAGKSHTWESNYLSYVKALPATIIMTGLGQALAMEKAQGNKPKGKENDVSKGHSKLYAHLGDWLCHKWRSTENQQAPTDILQAIVNGNEAQYIHAQAEGMAYLEWLKKFAVAHLVDKDDKKDKPGGAG